MPEPQSLEAVFAYLGKPDQPFKARPLQAELERLLEGINTPALFLVEAPMGEGKTEAAFYAHLRLQSASGHRGMYIALPTQATGNLMFERAKAFLNRYGKSRRLDLQLLHGANELVEAYQKIRVRPNTPEGGEEGVEAQVWFSHRKRGLLSEYAVGTVDQRSWASCPPSTSSSGCGGWATGWWCWTRCMPTTPTPAASSSRWCAGSGPWIPRLC